MSALLVRVVAGGVPDRGGQGQEDRDKGCPKDKDKEPYGLSYFQEDVQDNGCACFADPYGNGVYFEPLALYFPNNLVRATGGRRCIGYLWQFFPDGILRDRFAGAVFWVLFVHFI